MSGKIECHFLRILMVHQKKGGIHVYRSFMDASGWFRLTGQLLKISGPPKAEGHSLSGWLFL
jgi:hypothetical protein